MTDDKYIAEIASTCQIISTNANSLCPIPDQLQKRSKCKYTANENHRSGSDTLNTLLPYLDLLQCSSQFLLPPLLLSLVQELRVLGALVVDTALGLRLSLPAARALVLALAHRFRRVPVANALVAAVEKLVIWDVIRLDVLVDLLEGPAGQRVNLDQACLVYLDDVEALALGALRAAAAREHGGDGEVGVGALGGLDFGYPVVEVGIGFPELLAVLGFEF